MSFSVKRENNLISAWKNLAEPGYYPRIDCDLDYDEPAAEWLEGVISSLSEAAREVLFLPFPQQ